MRTVNGEAVRLDTLQVGSNQMRNIPAMYLTEGNDGDMWVASNTHGVFRLHCDEKEVIPFHVILLRMKSLTVCMPIVFTLMPKDVFG